jgi:hypothetical protein
VLLCCCCCGCGCDVAVYVWGKGQRRNAQYRWDDVERLHMWDVCDDACCVLSSPEGGVGKGPCIRVRSTFDRGVTVCTPCISACCLCCSYNIQHVQGVLLNPRAAAAAGMGLWCTLTPTWWTLRVLGSTGSRWVTGHSQCGAQQRWALTQPRDNSICCVYLHTCVHTLCQHVLLSQVGTPPCSVAFCDDEWSAAVCSCTTFGLCDSLCRLANAIHHWCHRATHTRSS